MQLELRYEEMSPAFKKWHVEGLPFPASIHEFLGPDVGDPHDHPFDFVSYILRGWYLEERYNLKTFHRRDRVRRAGSVALISATDIHRISEVSAGGCITLITPTTPYFRTPRFWTKRDGRIISRAWNEEYP